MGRNFGFFPFFKTMEYVLIFGFAILLFLIFSITALIEKRKTEQSLVQDLAQLRKDQEAQISKLKAEIVAKEKHIVHLEEYTNRMTAESEEKARFVKDLRAEESKLHDTLASLAETEERVRANMEMAIDQRSEALALEYQNAEEAAAEAYRLTIAEAAEDFNKDLDKKIKELNSIVDLIAEKKQIYDAIILDEQRQAKELAQRDFYRLNISDEDLNEVEKIREITPYLKNPEVLNKVLWTSYYQKPYQELIARLFNASKPSGIYKITCLPDSRIYIGQSVNVPNRFSEHIKRGLGAEPATKNRLYSAMKKWGVENFTFELMEEVPRDKLNERERYWIDYFQSAEYDIGLNGNKGVKE